MLLILLLAPSIRVQSFGFSESL